MLVAILRQPRIHRGDVLMQQSIKAARPGLFDPLTAEPGDQCRRLIQRQPAARPARKADIRINERFAPSQSDRQVHVSRLRCTRSQPASRRRGHHRSCPNKLPPAIITHVTLATNLTHETHVTHVTHVTRVTDVTHATHLTLSTHSSILTPFSLSIGLRRRLQFSPRINRFADSGMSAPNTFPSWEAKLRPPASLP